MASSCHTGALGDPSRSTPTLAIAPSDKRLNQYWFVESGDRFLGDQPSFERRGSMTATRAEILLLHRKPAWTTTDDHPCVPAIPSQLSWNGSILTAYEAPQH